MDAGAARPGRGRPKKSLTGRGRGAPAPDRPRSAERASAEPSASPAPSRSADRQDPPEPEVSEAGEEELPPDFWERPDDVDAARADEGEAPPEPRGAAARPPGQGERSDDPAAAHAGAWANGEQLGMLQRLFPGRILEIEPDAGAGARERGDGVATERGGPPEAEDDEDARDADVRESG